MKDKKAHFPKMNPVMAPPCHAYPEMLVQTFRSKVIFRKKIRPNVTYLTHATVAITNSEVLFTEIC